jgi:hypothetical protein
MLNISIRLYKDRDVRMVWDDAVAKWCVWTINVVEVLNGSDKEL